tara:strand:+ start:26 stop:394 length:369 start_codon:yes stop_codon:yes gene_type:complete
MVKPFFVRFALIASFGVINGNYPKFKYGETIMHLNFMERRKYAENLGKQWRSEVKDNDDIVLGSDDASDIIPSVESYISFLESKKRHLLCSIEDRVLAIDESIGYEKEFINKLQDNPNYLKS